MSTGPIDDWNEGWSTGYRDALDFAIQRVEALPWNDHKFWAVNSVEETVISAIKEKKIVPHDPLCEYLIDTDGVLYGWNRCDCDLISKVREDTILASVKRLEALTLYDSSGTAWIADPMNKVIAVIQASDDLP